VCTGASILKQEGLTAKQRLPPPIAMTSARTDVVAALPYAAATRAARRAGVIDLSPDPELGARVRQCLREFIGGVILGAGARAARIRSRTVHRVDVLDALKDQLNTL